MLGLREKWAQRARRRRSIEARQAGRGDKEQILMSALSHEAMRRGSVSEFGQEPVSLRCVTPAQTPRATDEQSPRSRHQARLCVLSTRLLSPAFDCSNELCSFEVLGLSRPSSGALVGAPQDGDCKNIGCFVGARVMRCRRSILAGRGPSSSHRHNHHAPPSIVCVICCPPPPPTAARQPAVASPSRHYLSADRCPVQATSAVTFQPLPLLHQAAARAPAQLSS